MLILAVLATLGGCNDDGTGSTTEALACDAEPEVMTTSAGVDFVRTPDACFEDLPDWPYAPQYVDIDGLRQGYVDEGPADGKVVLLLHGQPSWSYLYRKMIPVLVDGGYRVIAMDHLGMGRSDKPTEVEYYTYLRHNERLESFIDELELQDIHLFVQDWGSLIGLRVAGLNPDRFAAIAVGNGDLPVIPADQSVIPPIEDPDVVDDSIEWFVGSLPPQQPAFYDGCEFQPEVLLDAMGLDPGQAPSLDAGAGFSTWAQYAMKNSQFRPSEIVEGLTWFDLPAEEEAAYDAPYPSRTYMTGPRTFPSLVIQMSGVNDEARAGLEAFERPFLTIWGSNDPGNLGACATQDALICNVAGAEGQAHVRLSQASHFLQDDQGEVIAERLVAFFNGESGSAEYIAECTSGEPALPVTADGTGTPCATDADCVDLVASTCLTDGSTQGFCTIELCKPDGCGDFYSCCGGCNPAAADMLPFAESACLPEVAADQLEVGAGCTCD
ncbi:MAG: alpha/beta fold hydrolase [Acidimicrobiia bacterium]|nr:alpha/beta fold hydrolase [Acidimicrobiia bacterium]